MNKKGFTLMELLAVVAVLGILLSLGVVSVMGIRSKMNNKLLNTKIKMIESAGKLYGDDHNIEACTNVTINALVIGNYLDYDKDEKVINPVDNSIMNEKEVRICKENNQMIADYQE